MTRCTRILGSHLLALGLVLGGAARAAEPSVSVPSTPDTTGKVVVRGKDMAPLANVAVRFSNPLASPIEMVVQTAADGSFVLSFLPPLTGSYKVTVLDSTGRLVGEGNFGVIR